MCCTHYGYSLPLWNKALASEAASGAGGIDTSVQTACINPNSDMAEFLFKTSTRTNSPSTEIDIKVSSNNNYNGKKEKETPKIDQRGT